MEAELEEDVQEELRQRLGLLLDCAENLIQAWQCERSKRWTNRRWYVRPFNQRRRILGAFFTKFQEMKEDPELFFEYTRMDLPTFYQLLKLVAPSLQKQKKRLDVICPEQRLVVTLRYLATGDEVISIAREFRIGDSTAYTIIRETCAAIYKILSAIYLKVPTTPTWRNIAKGFRDNWNLPNCVGSVDGKHMKIKKPPNSGSLFRNYKHGNSIVFLGVCDHRYQFTIADVGAFGGESDGGILARSEFGAALDEDRLNIPPEHLKLPNSNTALPYYFVGDGAFRMTTRLMRPYTGRHLIDSKKIFNYRLSRGRRCIENAFGILASRWRVFYKPIVFYPKYADRIILASICLHNFLMSKTQKNVRNAYCPSGFADSVHGQNGQWRSQLPCDNAFGINPNPTSLYAATKAAHDMQGLLANYFMSPAGQVEWQNEYITRGRFRNS